MKRCLFLAAIAGSFLSWNAALSQAQSTNIAILDLGYIFKEHNGFKAATERMKNDLTTAETKLREERDSLNTLMKDFQEKPEFKKGSREYKQMEEELAKRGADLQIEMNIKKREFMEREARIYYNVYQEIMRVVRDHCAQQNIQVVLRFSAEQADPTDPQSILKDINKNILHWDQSIDITGTILQRLNQVAKKPPQGGKEPPKTANPPRSRPN